MHALFLVDSIFAVRERAMLSRLEVGLADEGTRVTLAMPTDVMQMAEYEILGEPVGYRASPFAFTRRLRATRLSRDLGSEGEDAQAPVDLVHAFGGAAWSLAAELCRMWEVPLVLELWRAGLVERARGMGSAVREPPVLVAPDPAIERTALRECRGSPVRLVPWGAKPRSDTHVILSDQRAPSIVLVGFGRDEATALRAFEGLARVMEAHEEAMLFVDADAAMRLGVWKRAKRFGIRDRVSLIARLEDRRDLVLRADVVVHPDARGEQRSLLLDAMACSMVIVASEDPNFGSLIENQTARLVPTGAGATAWSEAIAGVLDNPDSARALGESARVYTRSKHRVSAQVSGVIDIYEWVCGRQALAFKTGQS